jgi:Glu-tRNA(Gln) amidotransferase subunit E-like FAD-binding protein
MKVGLQIHKQISKSKLFCSCTFRKSRTISKSINLLRFTPNLYSESFKYRINLNHCKYQSDQQPPRYNIKLVKLGLSICKFFKFKILPEFVVMRKHILDGSLTSGFQRTGILGINGIVELNNKKVILPVINLEQDSCRKILKTWYTDRQGVGLLEIVTQPISEPKPGFIRNLAKYIGTNLEKLGCRSEIGSIRQDINIDAGLGKTEIKGIQDLSKIDKIIQNQKLRQEKIIRLLNLDTDLKILFKIFKKVIVSLVLETQNLELIKYILKDYIGYLQYYKIKVLKYEFKNSKLVITIKSLKKYKSKIVDFFKRLFLKDMKSTRVLIKDSYNTQFKRDHQTQKRMNLETELYTLKLNELSKNIKCINFLEFKSLNPQNSKILKDNSKVYSLIVYLNKFLKISDLTFNLALKIYNKLIGLPNTIRKNTTKDILLKFYNSEIGKLQIDYILGYMNKDKSYKLSKILEKYDFEFPKDQEINIEIRKLKSKGIPSSKYIGILLKHFGSKSNSFEN